MGLKQHRTTFVAASVLLSAVCVFASEPPSRATSLARRLASAPAGTERRESPPTTLLPTVQVDVYFTRESLAKPVGFERTNAGELWFLEAPSSGYGNLVHLLPSVPADSSFEMTPTQTNVVPDTYSATLPTMFTMFPNKSAATSVANTVSGDSAGAFVRYRIPTTDGWACDLEARDALYFTERRTAKVGRFDPATSRFEEWDTPTPGSYPIGLLACGDTVFFVEADSCRMGRLVVSDSEITEWDLPNTGYGYAGYPGLDRDSAGNLWLTSKLATHLLVEVEIGAGDTARLSEWTVPGISAEGPTDVVVDRDGKVWYSVSGADTSEIGVLDPVTQQYREWRVPDLGARVYYLELDVDGCIWFGENIRAAVSRLAPSENKFTTYPISISHGYVYDFTLDGKGNVWVAGYDDYALLRFSGIAAGVCEREVPGEPSERLVVRPNPFASSARVPGHENELFALSDVTGRQVTVCKGDRVGERLRPGVYFLSPVGLRAGKSATATIVKTAF